MPKSVSFGWVNFTHCKPAQDKRGFTLVELLVIIAIIAILAIVATIIFSGLNSSANDTKRKNDIKVIASAFENNYSSALGQYQTPADSDFASGRPKTPEGGDYNIFMNANNSGFRTCAALSNHPSGTPCDTSSSTCFCIDSTQSQYIASATTPTPGATATSTPAATSTTAPTPTLTPIPTPVPCTLASASWSASNVVSGTPVTMTVNGNNCNGQTVSFLVRENDYLVTEPPGQDEDASSQPNPNTAVFSGNIATLSWTAQYMEDGLLGVYDPPEFFFTATVGTQNQRSADPLLVVNQVLTPTPSPTPIPPTPTSVPTSTPIPPTATPTPSPVTVNFYAAAGDGVIQNNQTIQTWDQVRSATDGTSANSTGGQYGIAANGRINSASYRINRGFIPIDTSGLPDNATIISATLNLYVDSVIDSDNDGDDFVVVVQTFQPNPATLTTADFDLCGTVTNPTEGSNRIDITGLSAGYNAWTLNAAGLTWIKKTAGDPYTMLGIREGHDIVNSAYAVATYTGLDFTASEYIGTTRDPYLSITYIP